MKANFSFLITLKKMFWAAFWPSLALFIAEATKLIQTNFADAVWLPVALALVAMLANLWHNKK